MKIKTALLSVADKQGLPELADALAELKVRLFSTGNTAAAIRARGAEVTELSDLTGFGEMLGGRVKTLHPAVFAGILADGGNPAHLQELDSRGLPKMDLTVVNFYPFARGVSERRPEAQLMELIDIGGPAMARAAAKNFASAAVLVNPADYPPVIGELKTHGELSLQTRRRLAAKAFIATADFDIAAANYFSADAAVPFPADYFLHLQKQFDLTYGENPHQQAACYHRAGAAGGYVQLQGAPASYNNLMDAQAAVSLVSLFDRPAAAIIKHNNPCGVAVGDSLADAFAKAHACDTASAFGGVAAFNGAVGGETAKLLETLFLEVVTAPQFDAEAKKLFALKERLRLLTTPESSVNTGMEVHSIGDLFLAQTADAPGAEMAMTPVTQKAPDEMQKSDMRLAWRVAARTKSNAVVIARDGATAGIGAGQMSRVDSARLACQKLADKADSSASFVAASDGFFPFADSVKVLAKAGVKAIVQPGGGKRDGEIIAAADKLGIAMVFTGRRHFLH